MSSTVNVLGTTVRVAAGLVINALALVMAASSFLPPLVSPGLSLAPRLATLQQRSWQALLGSSCGATT